MKRILLLLSVIGFQVMAKQPHTLRLDYVHSGGMGNEIYAVDELVQEPLLWPGNIKQPIDNFKRGKYLLTIRDKKTDKTLYSRSFSSIYGEWETTSQAAKIQRSFHESLRFPKPDKPFVLSIAKRDAENKFVQQWQQVFAADNYLIEQEHAQYKSQRVAIHQSGDSSEKVDLLILGDGYTKAEHKDFIKRSKELTANFFSRYPFNQYKDKFNVWAIAPHAQQSGISRPSTGIYRNSPLGSRYDAFGSERYLLSFDNKAWRRVASSAPYDTVIILTNTQTYGGGGIYGLYSTAAANNAYADYLFSHEFGHHFAGLADEYYTSSVAYNTGDIKEPYEPNVTALLEDEPLKWGHLVKDGVKLPTAWPKQTYEDHSHAIQKRRKKLRKNNAPEAQMTALFQENQRAAEAMFSKHENNQVIGAFEGANYQAKGYYRSEMNCLMFTRTQDYCHVCGEAIIDIIDSLTK